MTSVVALSGGREPLAGSVLQLGTSYRRALEAQGRSPRTIQTYLEALARLDAFLERNEMPRLVALLQRDDLEAFVADVQRSRSPATTLARYRALQSFFRWCQDNGTIERNPLAQAKPPLIPREPTPPTPDDAFGRLLRACEGRGFRDRRDMAIVRLFIDTGLRRNELAMLRVEDIDLQRRSAAVAGTGGIVRTAGFASQTAQAIDRYLRIGRANHPNADSQALWLGRGGPMTANGIYQAIEVRAAKAGLERFHPQQFRQASARRLPRWSAPALAHTVSPTAGATTIVAPGAPLVSPAARPADPTPPGPGAGAPSPESGTSPSSMWGAIPVEPARARGTAGVITLVVATGLVNVASIARFKRDLGRGAGVRDVSVSSGPNGTILFEVAHDPATQLDELITELPAFAVRVVGHDEGSVQVGVRDSEG